jgi:hypothetical protein
MLHVYTLAKSLHAELGVQLPGNWLEFLERHKIL